LIAVGGTNNDHGLTPWRFLGHAWVFLTEGLMMLREVVSPIQFDRVGRRSYADAQREVHVPQQMIESARARGPGASEAMYLADGCVYGDCFYQELMRSVVLTET
jgi:hypothetical protein